MNFGKLAEDLGLEREEYLELIELFIETSMSDLDKLQSAIKEVNAEKAANAAHSLKGAARSIGLMELSETAKEIEEKAFGPDHPHLAITLSNLAILYATTADFEAARPLFEKVLMINEKANLGHIRDVDKNNSAPQLAEGQCYFLKVGFKFLNRCHLRGIKLIKGKGGGKDIVVPNPANNERRSNGFGNLHLTPDPGKQH